MITCLHKSGNLLFSAHLKIIRKFCTTSITRVHCDKNGTRWIQRDFCSFEYKLIHLFHDGSLDCQDLLSYHRQHLKNTIKQPKDKVFRLTADHIFDQCYIVSNTCCTYHSTSCLVYTPRRGAIDSWLEHSTPPGSSGLGWRAGRRHCVVFLGKTLNSHSASLHPVVLMDTGARNAGGNPVMD